MKNLLGPGEGERFDPFRVGMPIGPPSVGGGHEDRAVVRQLTDYSISTLLGLVWRALGTYRYFTFVAVTSISKRRLASTSSMLATSVGLPSVTID